ncbi:MAG: tetratricopeptide repeat protein [Lachnospiraceae bacterium]|nr:tetratricopeptide repeat protein [Lachnospiraceae bacterium]
MDRNEYKQKLDSIRECVSQGKIDEAVSMVESINWKKIHTVSALCLAGEVYEKAERYEESKAMLLEAYERSPIGRTIIYRLAIVAVKSGNMEEAEEFYNEFTSIAPTDNVRYILKYQISRAKGVPVTELIGILEEYKERESSERWSFELAMLYHKARMADKCVELCDEIILWYGEGKYVEKALELKMIYQPLTEVQEKKFRRMKQCRDGVLKVTPDEEILSGEILSETKVIPEVKAPSPTFNTVNLQQELADNMKKIMEATEKETVSSHMDQIKELVQTIPYLQMEDENKKEDVGDDKYGHIQTDEEIDGSLKIDFKEMLGEEQGGQMSLNVPNQPTAEQQITGQMSIEEVLKEWEKTKVAAKMALEVAEKKRLESAKARALKEAEGIMDRLNDVIPQLEAGKTPRQLMEEEYVNKMEEYGEDDVEQLPETEETVDSKVDSKVDEPVEKALEEVPENPVEEEEATEERKHITFLREDQKELFAYFLKVDGMEKQICTAMDAMIHKENTINSVTGNLLIEGGRGSGKTALALNLVKALRQEKAANNNRVGKITASALNTKDVLNLVNKVSGGYLIIEKAGDMNHETAEGLSLAMEGNTEGLTVIMEDTRAGLQEALQQSASLAGKFSEKISIPVFTIDELVHFAKSYAKEADCEIDEIAILALYNRISNVQKGDKATYVAEVKDIMDEAIANAQKGGFKKAFLKKKTNDGLTIIHEQDFQN